MSHRTNLVNKGIFGRSARHLRQRAAGKVPGADLLEAVKEARYALESAGASVQEALGEVRNAISILRKVPGSGVLAGNMDAYLRPWLNRMINGDSGGGIYLLDAVKQLEELEDELENMDEDDSEDSPPSGANGA